MSKIDILISIFSVLLIIVLGVGSMLLSVFYIYSPLERVCDPSTHTFVLAAVMIAALIVGEFFASIILLWLANNYASTEQRTAWRSQFERGKTKLPWLTRKMGNLMLSNLKE